MIARRPSSNRLSSGDADGGTLLLGRTLPGLLGLLAITLLLTPTAAAAAGDIDTGDTAWVLTASALVMLMTPGLALFYGGMVRRKNVVATLLQVFVILALVSILWPLIGYSLAFGTTHGGLIGGLDHVGLHGIGSAPLDVAPTIPGAAFMVFQMMFAIITPALIIGGIAERVSFRALILFTALWSLLVYAPVAHWVWGGGWLADLGALDFAGGTVVHITAGVAALACVLYMGHRLGWRQAPMAPHSVPLTVLGAGLLWFGWFGFNAGSALAANETAVTAFVATHLAAASAVFAWVVVEWLHKGRPTAMGAATGAVAGLVAVTPAAGFIVPVSGIGLGLAAGVVCYAAVVLLKHHLAVDDSLDAFGVHGVGGILGALLTGVLAVGVADPVHQLWVQLVGVAATAAYTLVLTLGILWVVDKLVSLRVAPEAEELGLDLAHHGEPAYDYCAPDVDGSAGRGLTAASTVLFKK